VPAVHVSACAAKTFKVLAIHQMQLALLGREMMIHLIKNIFNQPFFCIKTNLFSGEEFLLLSHVSLSGTNYFNRKLGILSC
jgi:hypothetical protein